MLAMHAAKSLRIGIASATRAAGVLANAILFADIGFSVSNRYARS